MYQFRTGFSISNNFTAHEALVAGAPVSLNADGELAKTADAAAMDGVVTTTASAGDYVGCQTSGFCATNQVNGGGAAIDFADQLEVSAGLFIKVGGGTVVAKSWGECDSNISASTTEMLLIEIL